MINSSVNNCYEIKLDNRTSFNGKICVVNNNSDAKNNIPFEVNRLFFIYDIPSGESRGAHAHKKCHQLLIATSGSFEVLLNDGINQRTFKLNSPTLGLYIPPGIWASEINFSGGSICLVLTSHLYIESDYIRDFSDFIEYKKPK